MRIDGQKREASYGLVLDHMTDVKEADGLPDVVVACDCRRVSTLRRGEREKADLRRRSRRRVASCIPQTL